MTRRARRGQPDPLPENWPAHQHFQITADDNRSTFVPAITRLMGQKFEFAHFLDWGVAEEFGLTARFGDVQTRRFHDNVGNLLFTCHGWNRLFAMQETVYMELCWEFFATVQFNKDSTNYDDQSVFSFRLGGIYRRCSIIDLARRLGLYTVEEIAGEHFRPYLQSCIVGKPHEYNQDEFWASIAIVRGAYPPRSARERDFRSPITKLLHRLVTITLAHKANPERVASTDLFYLWCLMNSRVLLNIPATIAFYLTEKATSTANGSKICGGHFVTRLARSFGLVPPHGMLPEIPRPIDRGVLVSMKVLVRFGRTFRISEDAIEVEPEDAPAQEVRIDRPVAQQELEETTLGLILREIRDIRAEQTRRGIQLDRMEKRQIWLGEQFRTIMTSQGHHYQPFDDAEPSGVRDDDDDMQ